MLFSPNKSFLIKKHSAAKELLELILDTEVGDIVSLEKQHPIEITPDGSGKYGTIGVV